MGKEFIQFHQPTKNCACDKLVNEIIVSWLHFFLGSHQKPKAHVDSALWSIYVGMNSVSGERW